MDKDILCKSVFVINETGIHCRPAADIAKEAAEASGCIWIEKDGQKADASSVVDIIALECFKGSKVTVKAQCIEDAKHVENIANMIMKGFI